MAQLELLEETQIIPDVELDPGIYLLPSEDKGVIDRVTELLLEEKEIAIDIETYGEGKIDGLLFRRGKIRTIQIGFRSGEVAILDMKAQEQWHDRQQLLQLVFDSLESPDIVKIFHNGYFECSWLNYHYGLKVRNTRDTFLLSKLLWIGIKQIRHSLKACCERYLEEGVDKTEQTSDWGKPKLSNRQLNYAAKDVRVLFPLLDKLKEAIAKERLDTPARIECACVPIYAEMGVRGFAVDIDLLKKGIEQHKAAIEETVKPFYAAFNVPITSASKTLVPLLNQKLSGLGVKLTSTADEELQYYQHVPSIRAIMLYRSLKKGLDFFTATLENATEGNGRAHSSFTQIGTICGRSSSGKPTKKATNRDGINLQNIIKPYPGKEFKAFNFVNPRSCFVASPGKVLIVSDFATCHFRFAAEMTGDRALVEAYRENQDLHSITGSEIAALKGKTYTWQDLKKLAKADDPFCKLMRNSAKAVGFGSLNYQGGGTLQNSLKEAGIDAEVEYCKEMIRAWRRKFPTVYSYQWELVRQANKHDLKLGDLHYGKARTMTSRIQWLPKYPNDYRNGELSVKINDACAAAWQGAEADVKKLALILVQKEFDLNPHWGAEIVNDVHDEIVAEALNEHAEAAGKALLEAMDRAMATWVKSIPVNEPGIKPKDLICSNWSEK